MQMVMKQELSDFYGLSQRISTFRGICMKTRSSSTRTSASGWLKRILNWHSSNRTSFRKAHSDLERWSDQSTIPKSTTSTLCAI
jgi:hypothetical protein